MKKQYTLTGLLATTVLLLSVSIPAGAGMFGPSENEKCMNEKVALEMKLKYCFKDKITAENELDALKRQYRNETTNLKSKIQDLDSRIENLTKELELCRNKSKEDGDLAAQRIDELEKTIAILKQSSSSKEQDLLQKLKEQQDRYESELSKTRKDLQEERDRYMKELAELKKLSDDKIAGLQRIVDNLNEELSSLKKLTKDQKDELERLVSQENELAKQLEQEIKNGEIRLKKFHDKLIINIDNRISFDSGSAELKSEVFKALDKIGKILENYPENRIMVEGHTDTDKIVGGKFRDNWDLSTERALAVLRNMLKNKNLDKSRFAAAGYGEFNPIVPNDTAENKALNRRVDIVVIPRVSKK
jgi:chemotaxis protein MotB